MAALERDHRSPGEFTSGQVRWTHEIVRNNLGLLGARREEKTVYNALRQIREKADYYPDAVSEQELSGFPERVREFQVTVGVS